MKIVRTMTKVVLIGMICTTVLVFGYIAAEEFIVSDPDVDIDVEAVIQAQPENINSTPVYIPKGVIILT